MCDSTISRRDSRSVRIISILGGVFIPFSAVCSVFGTQFFTSVTGNASPFGEETPYMDLNPQFWILWAIALPITLGILTSWFAWENWAWCQTSSVDFGKRIRGIKDIQNTGEGAWFGLLAGLID